MHFLSTVHFINTNYFEFMYLCNSKCDSMYHHTVFNGTALVESIFMPAILSSVMSVVICRQIFGPQRDENVEEKAPR